ncbi:MAG: hypothetical protein K6L60_05585 [Oceanobacter sp.]
MSGGLSTANFMSGLANGLNTGMGLIDARRRHEREDKAAERADKEFARKEALWGQQDEQFARQETEWQQQQDDRTTRNARAGREFERKEDLWKQQDKQIQRQELLSKRQDTQWQQQQDDRKKKESMAELQRDLVAMRQGLIKPDADFYGKHSSLGVQRLGDPQWRAQSLDSGRSVLGALDEFNSGGQMGQQSLTAIGKLIQPQLDQRTGSDGLKRQLSGLRRLPDGRIAMELAVTGKDGKVYKAPVTKNGTAGGDDQVITLTPDQLEEWAEVGLHRANAAYLVDQAGGDSKVLADRLHKIYFGKSLEPKAEYSYKQGYDQSGNKTLYQFDGRGGATQVGGSAAPDGKNRDKMAANDKVLWDAMAQYQKDAVTDPQAAADALANTIGVPSPVILGAMSGKRRSGDYSPLTYAELNEYIVNTERGLDAADRRMRQERAQAAARSSPAAPPHPEMIDPLYPDAARQRTEANQSTGIPAQAPRTNPREQKRDELQRQLDNAKTPEEQQAIIKKMAGLASSQTTPSSDADQLASF